MCNGVESKEVPYDPFSHNIQHIKNTFNTKLYHFLKTSGSMQLNHEYEHIRENDGVLFRNQASS